MRHQHGIGWALGGKKCVQMVPWKWTWIEWQQDIKEWYSLNVQQVGNNYWSRLSVSRVSCCVVRCRRMWHGWGITETPQRLCSWGTMDGARGLINRNAWDLATYLHAVIDTNQYQGLGMECSAAPTECACLFSRDCILKKKGTILAAAKKYNRAVAQVRGANPDS